MQKYNVVLQANGEEKDEYFDQQNNTVPLSRAGVWDNFGQASKAALRAATQDLSGRKAIVREI